MVSKISFISDTPIPAYIRLSAALVGFETVTLFASNFNTTQSFWYDVFIRGGRPSPGKLCDPHDFNIGDSFTTNYTLFAWDLMAVTRLNDSAHNLVYRGSTLDSCDVKAMYLNGDRRARISDIAIIITCGKMLMDSTFWRGHPF